MAKFQKGQSGNPGGRPAGLGEIRDIARQHTGEAIDVLVSVMNNKSAAPSARVAAATALLDRGWGRPTQTIKSDRETVEVDAGLVGLASDLIRKIGTQKNLAPHLRAPENKRETDVTLDNEPETGSVPTSGPTAH